jgi:hypothetical protein
VIGPKSNNHLSCGYIRYSWIAIRRRVVGAPGDIPGDVHRIGISLYEQIEIVNFRGAALLLGFGVLVGGSPEADEVNTRDGQWHFVSTVYLWTPFMYTTVQLPPLAGGGNPTLETQPSQYLKYVQTGALFQGTVQKGNWGIWTDFVYLNLKISPSITKQIGLPGGDPTLPVTLALTGGMRMAIWTLAPSYTVMNTDIGTLDVLAGLRYSSARVSLSYELTAPPTPLMRGGGFWPTTDSTDGIVGIKGTLRLSSDAKWFLPYEADVGTGNKNWQWNAFLGAGYHFHWGDVSLAVRNLTYNRTGDVAIEKVRMTGPLLGATFRW